jgi:hypothetical protein
MLYFALVRSKLECASIAWNSVMITDSNKFEHIQRKFATLCHNRFFQHVEYHYNNLFEKLHLLTLHIRRLHFDALSLVALNVAPLSLKQLAFVFLPGTYVTLPRSVAPSAIALWLDVFLLQMPFINLQLSSETLV